MLSRFRQVVSLMLVIAITSLGMITQAQAQGAQQRVDNRTRRQEILAVLARIDNRMTQFRKVLDERMDRSYLDDTRAEDNINRRIRNFFDSRDRLHASVKEREQSADEARDLLRRAALIDSFMVNRSVWGKVLKEWMDVRVALDKLAELYHITPEWNNTGSTGAGTGS